MRTKVVYLNRDTVVDDVVVALGEFDGIHKGHQKLLRETKRLSASINCKSAMLSFLPHPDYVLRKREYKGYLTSLEERVDMLSSMGIDYLFIIDFDTSMASIMYTDFYRTYLSKFKGAVVGYDFRFGYKGMGNATWLKNRMDVCSVIDKVEYKGMRISASMIRDLLGDANIKLANELLGRVYSVKCKCINDGLFEIDNDYYIPKNGKYKCGYISNGCEYNNFTCIIDDNTLMLNCNNVGKDELIKVQFIEYVESGV